LIGDEELAEGLMQASKADSTYRLLSLENRMARLKRRAQQLESVSARYWLARRVLFISGALLALLFCKYSGGATGVTLAVLVLVAFVTVVVFHNRVRQSISRNALMRQIKQVQVARINLDWEQLPSWDQSPAAPGHPFETDVDVTGERSLHRLLDTAVTKEGSRRLKSWLLSQRPDPLVIQKRQSLVRELCGLSIFRDQLHVHAAEANVQRRGRQTQPERWDSQALAAWVQHGVGEVAEAESRSLRSTTIVLAILAALNIGLVVLAVLQLIPHVWPIVFLIYAGVSIAKLGLTAPAWGEVQDLEKALRRFRAVFQYLESRRFSGRPQLSEVCAPFNDRRKRPSAELRRVQRIAAALGLRTNGPLWFLVNTLVPWDFFFTYRLAQLKQEIGELLPRWLDAWYELEALNSLANFAWLNPDYAFPEIVSPATLFDGRALGHPLLKPEFKICNDFELNEERRMVILTGSNMAGKSTFLRTVGLNLCLAYAGAPVNAERLRISLFRLFTCIKVSDSVQDGLSYFYAEVKRLKQLLSSAEADDLPTFFLIDEIFRGTNNRERHIGSHAFIKALSGRRNALGLIATHDLELTRLAGEIPGIANFHFREEVGEGRMIFDYQLRSGPCPTTNALQIMRLEGLPVDV
jgi:hypothetical protein